MKIVLNAFLFVIVFILGVYLGNSKVLKDDTIHVIIPSSLDINEQWVIEFCSKSIGLKEQFLIAEFECEGNVIIKKNNQIIDEIYITGGYDYYIFVDHLNSNKPTLVKVI